MKKLSFKTGEFEGPLDLLLFLISKHKLDIRDIEISCLLEQYMAYLDTAAQSDLEGISAFLEMASRLVYLKTVMLLPRHEEEGKQLKMELEDRLIQYQLCKLAAQILESRGGEPVRFVRRAMELSFDGREYRREYPSSVLYEAYQDAVGRGKRRLPPPAQAFRGIVARREVSVESRVVHLLRTLYRKGRAYWDNLFEGSADRGELVATFLALLELVRSKRVFVREGEVFFNRARDKKPRPEEVTV